MSKEYIIKTCEAFKPRLKAMIEADGGHFESKKLKNQLIVII